MLNTSFEDFERVDVVEASYENFENVGFAAGYFLRCVSMSGSRTRFSKCSVSGSPYFVDVELIQIEKNELSCGMFFRSLRCC